MDQVCRLVGGCEFVINTGDNLCEPALAHLHFPPCRLAAASAVHGGLCSRRLPLPWAGLGTAGGRSPDALVCLAATSAASTPVTTRASPATGSRSTRRPTRPRSRPCPGSASSVRPRHRSYMRRLCDPDALHLWPPGHAGADRAACCRAGNHDIVINGAARARAPTRPASLSSRSTAF